ncbi:hemerythrin domain-containing protein [Ferribacterium limneticum]|uniref:hemerythrin domain-containing protein n=1 Tax=Ferribacterium limneticum TaxID=76259 RepID=UPI001CFBF2B4|nr:hemerythrin domain-containing protein [Ferribacterium limneticum]UCV18780.1 hemerythrin domain-containing protein [Ferribacterium limneticum]
MKRHAALQQLSREHHHALKLSRLARFASDSGHALAIAEAAEKIVETFAEALENHFQSEEKDLLPALAAVGAGELVARTLAEHAELRDLKRRLAEPDSELLARFATLLYDHVRFEEREVFETAQKLLYPEH